MKTTKKEEKKVDVFLLLKDFQELIKKKPSVKKMIEEITMMGLKIKPIFGDISVLNLSNKKIVEVFWSLGKFDDFFQAYYEKLSDNELSILLDYFDYLKNELTVSLQKPIFKTENLSNVKLGIFEIEVLRLKNHQKKPN